jgi:pyruvate-ferredoxin/flavodoxin oxidoreductase
VGDDRSVAQSKLAVESRAYPLFRYDPDAGETFSECVSLAGNPSAGADWPVYALEYIDEAGAKARLDLPVTFADFAATEARFGKHFRKAPPETWNDAMIPLADLLATPPDQRGGRFPYIWAADPKGQLMRLVVAEELVRASEERLQFWRQLKDVAAQPTVNEAVVAERIRAELMQRIGASLGLNGAMAPAPAMAPASGKAPAAATPPIAAMPAPGDSAPSDYEPCWVETPECSGCSDCVTLAPGVFALNAERKAVVLNPKGGKFVDIVKSAEKCPAECLHPGAPWNSAEPGLDQLRARAANYN